MPKSPENRRSRIERGSLSEERIAGAALRLLIRDGITGLTMRGVAHELGAAPMSLYRHVRGHEALVGLVRARVLSAAGPSVEPGRVASGIPGWRTRLGGILRSARAQLRRYPGAVVLFDSETFRRPPTPRAVEEVLACLAEARVAPERLARVSAALWMHTVGSVLAEQSSAAAWPGEEIPPPRRKAWVATLRGELGPVAPRVAAEAASWSVLSHDEVFAEGLELLLDGLENQKLTR